MAQQTLPNPGYTSEGDAVLFDPEDLDITYSVSPSQDGSGSLIYVSGGTGKRYYAYDRLASGPDGQGCVTTGYAEEGTTPTDGVRTDLVTQNVLDIHGLPLSSFLPVQNSQVRRDNLQ